MSKTPQPDQKLRRAERLTSRKQIEELFKEGQAVKAFPLLAVWNPQTEKSQFPVQMAISVSKKRLKKAVDRNLLKRRVREAHRTNKNRLYHHLQERGIPINILYIFTGREIPDYQRIEKEINRIIDRLIQATT